MSRTLRLLSLVLLAAALPVRAQEPVESELDFVRKMRAKGYADLAKEYLDRMQKRNDPALAGILPLEQARTLLAVAREKDPEQRVGIFNQARDFLKDYTQKNAGKPEAAEGTLELARLGTYEGQAILTKALRELEKTVQHDLARPAETKFIGAGVELEAAIKLIQGLVDDPKVSEAVKKKLRPELTQARFDKGINLLDQARTYIDLAKEDLNLKRAQIVKQAKEVFDSLKEEDDLSINVQANAWLMKIAMESQDPGSVVKFYDRAMESKKPEARAGQRWARLFDMEDALKNDNNPRVKAAKIKSPDDKYRLVQKMGLQWLKDYPTAIKAPEGQAVLWELASAYYAEALDAEAKEKTEKDPKTKSKLKAAVEAGYPLAQKYYRMLVLTEGDYSEKANQTDLSISFMLMGNKTEFRTFEEFFLKGQFELLEMRQLDAKRAGAKQKGDNKEAEKYDREWKAKLKHVTRTFGRAIALATDRTPIQKLDEARYYQTAAYLLAGDLPRAAIAGEALGRTKPPTRRAPAGAGYAIDAYAALLSRAYNEGTKERLQGLVEYILLPENQKFWSTDPVTAHARYQGALLHNRDGEWKKAISELEKLPKEFPAYIYTQGQLVFISLKTLRENQNLTPREKEWLDEKVRAAVNRMPPLPNDADSTTAFMYYLVQIEKTKLMYRDGFKFLDPKVNEPLKAEKSFKEMGKFIGELQDRFDKLPIKITPENRETINVELKVMAKYAKLGEAEVQYLEGKFDDVLKAAAPAIDAVKKLDDGKGGAIKMKDYRVVGDTLGLALRAEVQNKRIKEGKQLLDLLKRLSDEGKEVDPRVAEEVVKNLLREIARQVRDLKEAGKEKKLKELVGSFGAFIDTLLKDSDAKKMSFNDYRMIAEAFSGLGEHGKAADLLKQYPPTKMLESKKQIKDMAEEEQLELVNYWTIQWDLVKELRAAKDYAAALRVLDGVPEDKKAGTKGEYGWLTHPKALFKMPYGYFEKNSVLEEDRKYGAATIEWNRIMKGIQSEIVQNPKLKKAYFDAYMNGTRTLYKYGLTDPAVKDKDKVIAAAAKRIIDLEFSKSRDGWDLVGPQFRKLLKEEIGLRKVYIEQFLEKAGRQLTAALDEKNGTTRGDLMDALAKRIVEFEESISREELSVVGPLISNLVGRSTEFKMVYDNLKKNR